MLYFIPFYTIILNTSINSHHSYEKLIDLKTFSSFGGYDFVLQWWHTVYIQAATFQA